MTFPVVPYVNSAPVLNRAPSSTDWGMAVRIIGSLGTVTIVQPSASTVSKVAQTLVSTTLVAGNGSRLGLFIFNDSPGPLYVKTGAGAGLDDWSFKICAGAYWEAPFSVTTQLISGIWSVDGTGAARVTELT